MIAAMVLLGILAVALFLPDIPWLDGDEWRDE